MRTAKWPCAAAAEDPGQDDHDRYLAKDRLPAPPIRPSGRWHRASRATEDHLLGGHISCNIDVPKFEPKLGRFFGQ
jgi:hypothetical protein